MPRSGRTSAPAQGLCLDQLQEITDVTDRVTGGGHADSGRQDSGRGRAKAITRSRTNAARRRTTLPARWSRCTGAGSTSSIASSATRTSGWSSRPEEQIAFFGGDPDNFTYPRFDLDMSFVRAYENGQPAARRSILHLEQGRLKGRDLVFVVGNPGSTGRLNTMAQLEYLRDVPVPGAARPLHRQITIYHALADADSARGMRSATRFSAWRTLRRRSPATSRACSIPS